MKHLCLFLLSFIPYLHASEQHLWIHPLRVEELASFIRNNVLDLRPYRKQKLFCPHHCCVKNLITVVQRYPNLEFRCELNPEDQKILTKNLDEQYGKEYEISFILE